MKTVITLVFAIIVALGLISPASAQWDTDTSGDMHMYMYANSSFTEAIIMVEMDMGSNADLLETEMGMDVFAESFLDSFGVASNVKEDPTFRAPGADAVRGYKASIELLDGEQPGFILMVVKDGHMFVIVGEQSNQTEMKHLIDEIVGGDKTPDAPRGWDVADMTGM
jgi:hypothetical protein